MQYISSEGLLIDTINKEVRILGSTNTISANSVAFLGQTNTVSNSSIAFGGLNNTSKNNSLVIGGFNTNVDNALAFSSTNSILSADSIDFDSNNIKSEQGSVSFRSDSSKLTASLGFKSVNDGLNNNSIGFLSKNNNLESSVLINGSNNTLAVSSIGVLIKDSTLNVNSVLFNSLSTIATLSGVGINSSFSTISATSLGINVLSSIVSNNSVGFLGSNNIISTNAIGLNALSSNISNNSLTLNGQFNIINNNSFGVAASSSNISNQSQGFYTDRTTLNNNSFAIGGSGNNINTNSIVINALSSNVLNYSFAIGGSGNNINTNSFGINALSSNISNNSVGLNAKSSNILLSSLVFNTSGSSLSGSFGYNLNNTQILSGLALNTTNSIISSSVVIFGNNNSANNNALIIEGDNNTVRNNSVILQSNNTDLSGNTFSTLTNNITARENVSIFNSSNGTISSNAVQINGNNNYLDNNSVSIQGSSNIVSTSSVNIASDSSRVYSNSTNLNGFNNTLSAKSIAISVDSSSLTDRGIAINSFSSNVSTNSISLNSRNVNLRLSAIDLLGSGNNVNTRSLAVNNTNSTVQNDGLSINTINSVVSGNSVLLGGNTNIATDNSFVINSSGSNAFVGSIVIGGRATTASLSAASINALNVNIRGANSLVLGGSGHDLNSTNSVYLGGQNNKAANTPSGSLAGNNSIILGGASNRTGSNGIVLGGRSNDANEGSIIVGGSGNNVGNFKNVVIIGRNDVTAGRDDIVYLPEINALGNLTISGDITASGTFTRVNTVTGSVSALEIDNLTFGLVPLTVNQRYVTNNNFDTARFSFYNDPRLSVNNVGVAINTFDRVLDQALTVSGNISATGNLNLNNTLNIGPDVTLYRSAANTLKTDDNLNIGLLATGATDNVVTHSSNTLQTRNINSRIWDTNAPFVSATSANSFTINKVLKASNAAGIVDSIITDNATNVGISTTTPNEKLTVIGSISSTNAIKLASGTTDANGIQFGTDTNLYRSAANTLKTDDDLVISNNGGKDTLHLTDTTADVGITIGADTNLYRSAANTLKTDDSLAIVGNLTVDGDATLGFDANDTLTINAGPINILNATNHLDAIVIGSDSRILRSTSNTLSTNANLVVGGLVNNSTSNSVVVENSGKLEKRTLNTSVWDTAAIYVSAVSVNSFTTNRILKVGNGAGITNSIITDDGTNVGIGTTNPAFKLEVDGTIRSRVTEGVILLGGGETTLGGQPSADGFRIKYVQDLFGTNKDSLVFEKTDQHTAEPDGGILFSNVGLGGVSSAALAIRGTGNIGVGTMFPEQKLTVVGNISSTGALMLSSGLTRDTGIQFGTDVSIYRSGVDQLQTDDTLVIGLSTIAPNMTRPTNETSNDVIVRNVGSGALFRREINPIIWNTTATFLSADASPTINALQKYKGSNSVEDSIIIDNGTNIGINTGITPLGARLTVNGAISSNSTITTLGNINGTAALILAEGTTQTNGVQFGTDTNIYRSTANTLKTDDNLNVGLLATGATDNVVTHSSNTLQTRNINTRVWDTAATFLSGSSLTLNRVAKISGPNSIANTNITDDGTTTTIAGTNLAFKNSSKVFDLYNASDYFRFNHVTAGVLKFSYNNYTDLEVNGANSYIYTPNQLLINTTTTGDYKLRVNGTSQFDQAAVFASTVTISGEPLIRFNRLKMGSSGHYTTFLLNSENFYILYGTDESAGANTYNALRPFRIENSTGDTYLANGNVLARHTDGKLFVKNDNNVFAEVTTAATWASLVPVHTPIQIVSDKDNINRIIVSRYMAPHELSVRIVSRRANSKFLIRTNVFHNGKHVTSLGHLLFLGDHVLNANSSFTRRANSVTVVVNFVTAHNLVVGDLIRISTANAPAGIGPLPSLYHSENLSINNTTFRVHTVPSSTSVQFDSYDSGGNTASDRASTTAHYARVYKYRPLNAIPPLKSDGTITNNNGASNTTVGSNPSIGTIFDGNTTADHMYNTTVESLWTPNAPVGTVYYFEGSIVTAWGGTTAQGAVRVNDRLNLDMRSQSSITVTEIA
jgi:hypothetical protein